MSEVFVFIERGVVCLFVFFMLFGCCVDEIIEDKWVKVLL